MKKYSGTKLIFLSGLFIVMTFNMLLICLYFNVISTSKRDIKNNMVREDNIFKIFTKSATIDIEPLKNNLINLLNIDSIPSPSILYLYSYNYCNNCIYSDITVIKECSFFKVKKVFVPKWREFAPKIARVCNSCLIW